MNAVASRSPRPPRTAENLTELYIRLSLSSRPAHLIFFLLTMTNLACSILSPGYKRADFLPIT